MRFALIAFLSLLLLLAILATVCRADKIDDLIPFIIQVESGGNPNAVSKAGAIGLMQITPIVLKEYMDNPYERPSLDFDTVVVYAITPNKYDLMCPSINVKIGEWYLRRLKNHYLKETNVQIIDNPFVFNEIGINTWGKIPTYKFNHTKYIKCAKDYKLALMLAAYNGGITRLRKNNYDISKMPKETKDYVRKIMRLYETKN